MCEDLIKKYTDVQIDMQSRIVLQNYVNLQALNLVAGVDLAYWKKNDIEYAVCCIVIVNYNTKTVIESKYCVDKVTVPYISGYLSFREIPLFLKPRCLLNNVPDLYFFDGNGYLHPRHMCVATQAGILIDTPSIGVAKTYCRINGVDFKMPLNEKFAFSDIVINGEIYGRVLRTKVNVKPIFVSIGNKIDLETATFVVKNMVMQDSHIPLPTRLADIMTHRVRKEYS